MFVFYSSHKIPPSNSLFPQKYKDSGVDTRPVSAWAAVGVASSKIDFRSEPCVSYLNKTKYLRLRLSDEVDKMRET